MRVTITITDVAGGKVDIACDAAVPDIANDTPCEPSRLVAAWMVFASSEVLKKNPVRRATFGKTLLTKVPARWRSPRPASGNPRV